MEISKTIKFVGPFNQQLIKKLFPIFLILNVLLLPLKIFFSSSFLTQIISAFIEGIIFIFIIEALKKNYNNEKYLKPRFSNIKITLQKLLRIFIASILPIIFVLLGLVCFLIPGLILAKRYMYVQVIAEEESIGPLNAMKKSKLISKNQTWGIFSEIFWLSVGYAIIGFLIWIIFVALISPLFIESAFINPFYVAALPYMVAWIVGIPLNWFSAVHILSLIVRGYQEGKLSITKN